MARRHLPRQREALARPFSDDPTFKSSSTRPTSTSTIKREEKERSPGTAITGRMAGWSWMAGRMAGRPRRAIKLLVLHNHNIIVYGIISHSRTTIYLFDFVQAHTCGLGFFEISIVAVSSLQYATPPQFPQLRSIWA